MKIVARPTLLLSLFCCFLAGLVGFSSLGIAASAPAAELADRSDASELLITANVQKTILDNGLTVITKEIHTAPVVSVQVWYRVGSRNEIAGQNGISHQLEHLMFKGTTTRPIQFGRFFSALGSQFNAFTGYDETAYFNTVESNKLDALLLLEADRMVNTVIEQPQLQSEQHVVISELQGYENSPDYRLNRAVLHAALPNHPYGLPVGGTKADVEQFTVAAVKAQYQTYYRPSNAVLVITGDFETNPLLQKVQSIFGPLARQDKPNEPSHPPLAAANHSQPILLQEPGSLALLNAVYPLPAITHPDIPAIDLMDAILTSGRSSRLNQALVESGLSGGVGTYASELTDLGWYEISADAAPGQEIAQVDQVLQQSLATLRQQGVAPAELERAKTQLKTSVVFSNQDITSQASQLAYSELIAGDYRYSDRYLAAIEQVTTADIQRVAQRYLDPAKRTIGFFQPTQLDDQANASATNSGASRTVENFSPGQPVDPAELARYLPALEQATLTSSQPLPSISRLDNGITVLLLPDPSTATVMLDGWIEAGSAFDPTDKAGLASLTADNLMNGTTHTTALEIATRLEDQGVSLGFGANREGVSFAGSGLDSKLPLILQTLAEVLPQATFPNDQLELTRQQEIVGLQTAEDDPDLLAVKLFQQRVYPNGHPYQSFPTEATLKAITQADVISFYRHHYRPESTVISLVGRFDPAAAKALLNRELGQWQAKGSSIKLQFPPVTPQTKTHLVRSLPGKAQAVTYLGYYGGLSRTDPRLYAAIVMNQILGGDTLSSRLGTEIRDRQGLTYSIASYLQSGRQPGSFMIEMQTAPDDSAKAIDSTIALLKQIQSQGFTPAEIAAAKRSITSSYAVELANLSSVGATILSNQVYGLSPEEIRQFPQQIEAVTTAQVQQVIQELIRPENLIIVTVGP